MHMSSIMSKDHCLVACSHQQPLPRGLHADSRKAGVCVSHS